MVLKGTICPATLRVFSLRMSAGVDAKPAIALDVYLKGTPEKSEVVHVGRTEVYLERIENVIERHVHALGLAPVDIHVDLRRFGAKARKHANEFRPLLARIDQTLRNRLQLLKASAAPVLDHKRETARAADPLNRRRAESKDERLRNLRKLAPEGIQNGVGAQVR